MVPRAAGGLMRIVAHNGANIWGGAEMATVTLLRGLASRGHEVTLLCNSNLVAENAFRQGVPARMSVIGGDVSVQDAIRLSRVLRALRPDAFIIGTYKKLFLAALAARRAGVPRVVARIGLETDTPRSWKYRFALRNWTDAVAVNARRIAKPFAELEGFGSERVRLIWNGVATGGHDDSPGPLRVSLGIAAGTLVVGTIARLVKQKRIDRLLDAVRLLPDIHCIIAGDGPMRRELESLAARAGIEQRVHFLGGISSTVNVLDSLDVFVVTSDTEGLSNAMLEAMSRGLPVISTPVSGADDALDGEAGGPPAGIVTNFSSESIARAISSLDDPRTRQAMGSAGRNRASSRFSYEAMLDAWEDFLSPQPP